MQSTPEPKSGWRDVPPQLSDEGLMLAELSHRVGNEVAASLAAVRLALASRGPAARYDLLRAAVGRLEGFSEVLGVLNTPPADRVDLAPMIERLCEGICASRPGAERVVVSVDAAPVHVSSIVARMVVMVAYELIHNAFKHALDGSRGLLAVVLRGEARMVRIAVVDDGPGMRENAASSGTGMGGPLIREIVRRAGGFVEAKSGPRGTRIVARLPLGTAAGLGLKTWEN